MVFFMVYPFPINVFNNTYDSEASLYMINADAANVSHNNTMFKLNGNQIWMSEKISASTDW